MSDVSKVGPRPPRDGSQSVDSSIVIGDVIQIRDVGGDVTITAGQPQYRIEDFPTCPVELLVAKARAQPSRLLLARHAVVAFTGRDQQLRDLSAWLADGEPVAVRLVHGAGGQGKTRLASRLAADCAAAEWQVWRALHGSGPVRAPLVLPNGTGSLLVVVDYADRWPASHLIALVGQLHALAGPADAVLRVLLLARSAGFWWAAFANQVDSELGIGADEQELAPLGAEVDRTALFTAARDAFATAMDLGPVDHIQAPDVLGDEGFAQVLAVHMAALAAVDAYRHGDSAPADPQAISTYLLRRERTHWHQLHARSEDRLPTTPQTMGRAVFVATLTGALPRDDAHTALADSGVVSTMEMANQIIDDHRTCYPPVRGDEVLEPLHPDRLGEDFVALTFPGYACNASGCDDWAATAASRLLTGVEGEGVLLLPSYTPQALTVLIEVARRWPHVAQRQLYPLLREQPWLALVSGSAAMARLASLGDIDIGALEAIEQLIPNHPHVSLMAGIAAITQRMTDHRLATATDPGQRGRLYVTLGRRLAQAGQWEQALIACGEAVDIFRSLASVNPAAFERDLALALTNIGVVLAHLGRWEKALAANAEAVEVGHRLAASGATTDLSGLAHALSNLGARMSELGRWEEALERVTEAVKIYHRLTTEDAGFQPDLATALANLGARLSDIGRVEESLIASSEAADILRRLMRVNSTVFEPELAIVLNNIGAALLRLGRREKALAIMSETIDLRRRLAAANPASFEPDLGGSLAIFGGVLADLGRWREALAATAEAVDTYRRLAAACMAKYEPDLGGSLVNHSTSLLKLGRWEEALTATTEAVEIYRRLAAVYIVKFEPLLALALINLGGQLSALESREEALAATTESVEIYRRLARENPDEFEPRLALALNNLGSQLSALGRREEALAASTEAVNIYRRLAQENPTAFEHDLAMALANLSGDLSNEERREEALTVNLEAVNVYRRLAQANPTAFEHDLAWALNNLGKMLFRLGMQEEALNAYTEAIGIYRRLAQTNPAAFESNLATALSNVGLLLASLGEQEKAVTATGEAVETYRRLAHTNPIAFRPMLAQALRAAATVRAVAEVELPQALDAAEQSAAIYQDLAATHPAAFADDLIDALHIVADILDDLGKGEEAAQTKHRAITTGGLTGISRILVGDGIREELGEVGLSQVMTSLFPIDCQTCGRPLGSAPPVLHVDDLGSYASADLHHSRCKTSEWNRAVSGVLIVRGTSEACLTWIARAHLLPAPNSRVTHPLPMLLVNPGLESIRLERNPSGQWRIQIETWFCNAGLRPVLRFGEPIEGARAGTANGEVSVTMRAAPFQTYSSSDPHVAAKARELGGLIFAVTHAVNPAAVTTMHDLKSIFTGDRSLMGWVKVA